MSINGFLPDCACVQLCQSVCNPLDYCLPSSSVHQILQSKSGLPFPPSEYLSDPGIKSLSAALLAGSLPAELLRKPFSQDIVISENIRTQEKKIQNPKRVCYIFYKLKVKCPNLNIFTFFKTYKYTTTLYKNM